MNDFEGLLWTIEKACCERLRVPTVHNLLFSAYFEQFKRPIKLDN